MSDVDLAKELAIGVEEGVISRDTAERIIDDLRKALKRSVSVSERSK
jgi:hypothetical protein